MARNPTDYPLGRWTLAGLLLVLCVRGLVGGAQFVLVPSGDFVGVSTRVLAPTPVRTFLLPGVFLFVAFGVAPLLVLYGLFTRRRWARPGAVAVALVLGGWALLEGVVLGFGDRLQYVSLAQAILVLVLAAAPSVRAGNADVGQPPPTDDAESE